MAAVDPSTSVSMGSSAGLPVASAEDAARRESNERFLGAVAELYTGRGEGAPNADVASNMRGLCDVASLLSVKMLPPARKVTVLLTGNHSSGKSSFINWYCGEKILKTGAAIETQGFSFVTSGKRRETLKGQATMRLFPRFRGLERFAGVGDLMETEIVPVADAHSFGQLTFIDSPGLVDGSFKYPFDIEATLLFLAAQVDHVLVFFDPIGQALCSRTMRLVTELNTQYPDKLNFVVSKMDTVDSEYDRSNVLIQITQNLVAHIASKTALRLPTMHLPRPGEPLRPRTPDGRVNGLIEVIENIDRAINATVQRNIERARTDAGMLRGRLQAIAKAEGDKTSINFRNSTKSLVFGILVFAAVFCCVLFFLAEIRVDSWVRRLLPRRAAHPASDAAHSILDSAVSASIAVPDSFNLWIAVGSVAAIVLHLVLKRCCWAAVPALDRSAGDRVRTAMAVCKTAESEASNMFETYLSESVHAHDM
eukprot:c21324_g1_i1.p2 GENE.c21324_g1_i1~~c21324_g1_i1.p2  ORF type:complete len:489 (+),score=93.58 c21324_g1_i1:30-1469(+)